MVDRAALERYRSANKELSARVRDVLEEFFLSLDLSKPDKVRDALLEFTPALTTQYGDVAAVLAADYYEEMRGASGAAGKFRTSLAKTVPGAAVASQTRYLAGHLWTPTPEAILGPLLTSVDKYVKQPGRDTIVRNASREGVRWARVPTGPNTCSFCLILASRDAVYLSEESAGGDGDSYHGDCYCMPVRMGPGDEYPEGYLPDSYYEMYTSARDEAQSGDIRDISAAMRRQNPDLVTDGVHTH
ncbi:hypothetical protein LJ753_16805 [Arthrobacter sp. zg-Y20]|uniref:VG15 protein n=1 Tax=unclassified Arthrobacter TaxID=235627 RepID=UPI001D15D01E|nr:MULTISPECIES: hypothetical protein [unclassified Arthrobacter]MCC3277526.1 hypothetical protein [Arthrobacter sp. zg-Y20]MDK1317684.1 hypothetical protein [Arthrobacter sp. zg.Y20]WIB07057.1 hypothetical protein QNO06_04835 [Arthrobacter sp. zg-Y20]